MLLGACTRNHGDIGPWFGTWHVERITAGGLPLDVDVNYFFQFQSMVFRVSKVKEHNQLVESFGIWDENGDKMAIIFPDSNVFYIEMPGLESHNEFTIATASSKEVTFSKVTHDGVTYTYHLKKQP